jgi:hypothetical protein
VKQRPNLDGTDSQAVIQERDYQTRSQERTTHKEEEKEINQETAATFRLYLRFNKARPRRNRDSEAVCFIHFSKLDYRSVKVA